MVGISRASLVWFADIAAYMVGSRFGKHKMIPHPQPQKELGGLLRRRHLWHAPHRSPGGRFASSGRPRNCDHPLRGLLVGLVMSILPTLGDLGESMIKRQAGAEGLP